MSGRAVSLGDDGAAALRQVLDRSYWVVSLAFLAVVLGFTRDRVCADHLNLLPAVAGRPAAAWMVALAYAAGYCWAVVAWALMIRTTASLLPGLEAVRAAWPRPWRFAVLAGAFLLEYAPPALLRAGAALCG